MMGGERAHRRDRESRSSPRTTSRSELAPHYPVLYSGPGGLVAHECILDLRPLKATSGIEAEDVAKRLIDYGFHAPTMSFPGRRHADGRADRERVEARARPLHRRDDRDPRRDPRDRGRPVWTATTIRSSTRRTPPRPSVAPTSGRIAYSRALAAYPLRVACAAAKYWPPVARVDNVYGDRNLFCTCIPVADRTAQHYRRPRTRSPDARPGARRGRRRRRRRVVSRGRRPRGHARRPPAGRRARDVVRQRRPDLGVVRRAVGESRCAGQDPASGSAGRTRRCCSACAPTGANGGGASFLIECLPSRTRHNTIQCLNLALYSRDCLQALRARDRHPLRPSRARHPAVLHRRERSSRTASPPRR